MLVQEAAKGPWRYLREQPPILYKKRMKKYSVTKPENIIHFNAHQDMSSIFIRPFWCELLSGVYESQHCIKGWSKNN